MAFDIIEKLSKPSVEVHFNPKFRAVIEDHLNILKTANVSIEPIDLQLFWKYEGNFYGLLTEMGIKMNLHWIYLRVNGFHHPFEFAKEVRDPLDKRYDPILINPSEKLISDLIKYHMSRKD